MVLDPTVTAFDLGTWRRIDEIFRQALTREGADRERFLESACSGDSVLRQRVASLLELDSETFSVLDRVDAWAQHANTDPFDALREAGAIPGFRLGDLLGEGGTSVVFAAEDEDDRLGRRLAIKLLRSPVPSARGLARFIEEGRFLARLDHPSIARLFDAGTTVTGVPFLVMERVDGQPIDRYCSARSLSTEQRVELFRQVCGAVSYAHSHLIVHRDLKPSNILVTDEGLPKLVDFGIAKLLAPDLRDDTDPTDERPGPMTPRFASPEQLIGEPVTVASDVYSLGTVLYDLLAGWPPSEVASAQRRIGRAVTDLPPKPSSTLAHRLARGEETPAGVELHRVRSDLDVITLHALAPAAGDRYSSADHLAEDLGRWNDSYPIEARSPSWRYRAGCFFRRHRGSTLAATSALLMLITLTVILGLTVGELRTERDRAQAEQATSEQVTTLLVELLRIAEPTPGAGPTVPARALLDSGVAKLDTGFVDDPKIEAILAHELANLYANLGLFEEASKLFQRAHQLRIEVLGENHPETLASHGHVAATLLERGDFDRAVAEIQQAIALCRSGPAATQRERDELLPRLLTRQALTLIRQGDLKAADPVIEEAIDRQQRLPHDAESSAEMIHLLNLRAVRVQSSGDLTRGEELLRQAIAFGEATVGYDSPEMFPVRKNLANNLTDQRHPEAIEESHSILVDLLAAERDLFGPDHPRIAFTLNQLGNVHMERGNPEQAEQAVRESLRVRSQALGPDHPANAPSLSVLGKILQQRGDVRGAEEAWRNALAIMEAKWPPTAIELAHVLGPLGDLLTTAGRAEEAEPLLRRALSNRRAGLPEGAPPVLVSARTLGRCLTALGRFEESEAFLLEAVNGFPAGAEKDRSRADLDDLYRAWGRPDKLSSTES